MPDSPGHGRRGGGRLAGDRSRATDGETPSATFVSEPGAALQVLPDVFISNHRQKLMQLAARHRLPAVYPRRDYVEAGGLISYGIDLNDLYRRSASYVARILKGENPAELPVQAPTKYELIVNLTTAKVLGLTISPSLLARADEVIE